ncbi:MAG TPA: arginyl aminopeptidase, partial [Bacteroidales bacterium]|nr:arginyl aminopeptidase [Bacteroidales bacterium]
DIFIESRLQNTRTQNVIGYLPGKSDSLIVFTAHYDHVGMMGNKTFFPGAHDNASGTAMVLDLARFYASKKEKPEYSMLFIFFAGEELGLLGSLYYVQNPVYPLENIKFLVNLDMISGGEKGIKVVNGSVFQSEFDTLSKLNKENNLLADVSIRGAAANSDHYYFYEKGVKCFFIYSLGAYSEYHTVNDKAVGLPLYEYEDIFNLLTLFVQTI